MGIAALVLGIIAFFIAITIILAPLGLILAVVGLILGIVDTVKKEKTGEKKVISIVGLVLCAVMLVVLVIETLFVGIIGLAIADEVVSDIDTGKITNTITDTAKNSFNAQFDEYEGEQTGIYVKALLLQVSTSNALHNDHQIKVYYNYERRETSILRKKIVSSNKYRVSIYESIVDGYIDTIYITPIIEKKTDVNNDNTTNTNINSTRNGYLKNIILDGYKFIENEG